MRYYIPGDHYLIDVWIGATCHVTDGVDGERSSIDIRNGAHTLTHTHTQHTRARTHTHTHAHMHTHTHTQTSTVWLDQLLWSIINATDTGAGDHSLIDQNRRQTDDFERVSLNQQQLFHVFGRACRGRDSTRLCDQHALSSVSAH